MSECNDIFDATRAAREEVPPPEAFIFLEIGLPPTGARVAGGHLRGGADKRPGGQPRVLEEINFTLTSKKAAKMGPNQENDLVYQQQLKSRYRRAVVLKRVRVEDKSKKKCKLFYFKITKLKRDPGAAATNRIRVTQIRSRN